MTRRQARRWRYLRWIWFVVMLGVVLIINAPIITLALNSLRTTDQILTETSLIPRQPSLVNYQYLSFRTSFWSFFRNSMFVAATATAFTIIGASLAGYALSRYRIMLTAGYARLLLMVQMFPIILALIPLFIIFRILQLVDTYWSVILIYAAFQLPFATWMFRSFFDSIPRDLEEAAMIDGCSRLMAFRYVVLPLCAAAFTAVTIFAFLFTYNEYLIANIFLRSESVMTVPVGIQMFMQQYSSDWGNLMAAATMAMLPTFVLFLFVQRYMLYTAIGGAVKG
ncbi:MAG: carbohydrate ABC transporter permease [Caldilineaceae bacterium]